MELSPHSSIDLSFEPSHSTKGKYLVLDTETTGFLSKQEIETSDPKNLPRIIQIAWLLFDDYGKLISSNNRYILQELPIPPDSIQIHGIDDSSINQMGEKPAAVWNDFIKDLENCEYLVVHNIDFDIPVIEHELSRLHIYNPFSGKRKICTMKQGMKLCRIPAEDGNGLKYPALDDLYKICFFGRNTDFAITGLHNASVDVAITAKIFFKMLSSDQLNLNDSVEEPFKLPGFPVEEKIEKSKFFIHIILPTFLTILLFLLAIFFIIIPRFKENIMMGKRQLIRELTNSASSILDKYENDERNGLMTKEEAQTTAISRIQYLRYGDENKDYFWITNMNPEMIMHPYRSDLNGKSLKDFTDPHGKKLFVEMVNVCNKNGQGYVEYMWQWKDDSTHIVSKLSYVKEFKPWGWIIGTGIYVDDVKKEIVSLTQRLLFVSLGISLITALLLTYITLQSMRIERKRKNAESLLRISREKYKTLVDATTEGLIMMLDQKMIFFNNTIHDLTGFSEKELSGQMFSKLISKNNPAETLQYFQNRNLPDGQYELKLSLKNGNRLDTIVTISSIVFAEKNGKLITIKDASVHKPPDGVSEDILQILELAGIGFIRFVLDAKGKIIYSSKAMAHILGFTDPRELTHSSILDFFVDPGERRRYRDQLLTEKKINHATFRLKRKNGNVCVVSATIVISENESQHLLYDGIIEDVTKRTLEIKEKEDFISQLQAHSLLLHNPVESLIIPVTDVQMETPVSHVIELMKNNHTDVVIISGRDSVKIGIVTSRDISERVLLAGFDIQRPIYEIMSAPLVCVNPGDSLYQAITLMQDSGISQLVAKNSQGSISGIIQTKAISHSLFNTYSVIENQIDCAHSVGEIAVLYKRFLSYLSLMINQTINPLTIGKSISSISDRITGKLITMAIQQIGVPPVEFTFIALGSEGRMEQTIATDQDNAIIYQDVAPEDADRIQIWFNNLGEIVCDHLNSVGFKYCKGRIMAKNPLWCKPISTWKNYFSKWISTPEPKNLLDISVFFDLRSIYGNTQIVDELHRHIDMISDGQSSFFYNLADNVLSFKPSLGITGTLHTEKKDGQELFDLKNAVTPYIMFARIYSICHKVPSSGTAGRIRSLFNAQVIPITTFREITFGYTFLMMLRYKNQIAQLENIEEITNMVDIHGLLEIEVTTLKKILSQIADLQNRLSLDFKRSIL